MEQNTKKILITTGIIAALSLVAYKLLAKNKTTGSDMPLLDKTPLDVAPPIEDISIYDSTNQPSESSTTQAVTYSSEELADMLQKAFDGNGTNWSAGKSGGVVGVLLQLKSDEDFDNLNAAYGIRTIKAGFLTGLFAKPFVGDMNGAFNSELNKREIAMANEILSKKGVTRRIELLETNKKD